MKASEHEPGPAPVGRDDGTPSNRANQPAQGVEGRREDETREPNSRLEGPGFGKGSNAV